MQPTCEQCLYFEQTHHLADDEREAVAGYCRRYAPVPPGTTRRLDYAPPDNPQRAVWPIVAAADWCGEHSASETAEAEA